jgi:hypothetical protein
MAKFRSEVQRVERERSKMSAGRSDPRLKNRPFGDGTRNGSAATAACGGNGCSARQPSAQSCPISRNHGETILSNDLPFLLVPPPIFTLVPKRLISGRMKRRCSVTALGTRANSRRQKVATSLDTAQCSTPSVFVYNESIHGSFQGTVGVFLSFCFSSVADVKSSHRGNFVS